MVSAGDTIDLRDTLQSAQTNERVSLLALSRRQPILLAFLRHTGCPFCAEALADLASKRSRVEARGLQIVLVHQSSDEEAGAFFQRYNMHRVPRVADPDRALYRALGLRRASPWQYAGPRVVWRLLILMFRGFLPGALNGDRRQLPGIFLISDGRILYSYRHRTQADRPDYEHIAAQCPMPPSTI